MAKSMGELSVHKGNAGDIVWECDFKYVDGMLSNYVILIETGVYSLR